MHVNEYNEMHNDKVMITLESKTAPYFTSLQEDWMEEMAYANIHVVLSESFEKI